MRGFVGALAFIGLIGTVGSLDLDYITCVEFIQRAVGLFGVLAFCIWTPKIKRRRNARW